MSKTIKYKINFYTDWHCGSGLSAGVDLDALVIKDKKKLPFIPGKTIKGLVRESVDEMNDFMEAPLQVCSEIVIEALGEEGKSQGCCFFTNACLDEDLQETIVTNKLQEYLYRSLASTAIDENGVAEEHSLRKMEACVPCELQGEILDVPEDMFSLMEKGLKFIKRLGQNRNRGIGRCQFIIIPNEKGGNE